MTTVNDMLEVTYNRCALRHCRVVQVVHYLDLYNLQLCRNYKKKSIGL